MSLAKVTIKKAKTNSEPPGLINLFSRKYDDYTKAVNNTRELINKYGAQSNSNAFHEMLIDRFKLLNSNELKVLEIPVFSPSLEPKICQRIIAIGNPTILNALRRIPRHETIAHSDYLEEHSEEPRIHGTRPFNGVLKAIGMGVLSDSYEIHNAFIHEMIELLGITSIEKDHYSQKPYKKNFVNVVIEETEKIIDAIKKQIEYKQSISLDFRLYALKIFLRGFYPEATWEEQWIKNLSQAIEVVSNSAFIAIMNPYSDLKKLEKEADEILSPFIDEVMKQKSSFLSEKYITGLDKQFGPEKSKKIQREILISLLFAGGDNIKKYLDHCMVEFGKDDIREKYLLTEEMPRSKLKDMVTEVGRLYPVIYAQPGKALDDFIIEYEKGTFKKTIYVRKGDELHFSTFQATVDEMEWGEDAKQFNPEGHKPLYRDNNATALFGGGERRCRGQSITLAIINYLMEEINKEFIWSAYVNGKNNTHPTEFNFNYGVSGKITFEFTKREKPLQFTDKKATSQGSIVPIRFFKEPEEIEENKIIENTEDNLFILKN